MMQPLRLLGLNDYTPNSRIVSSGDAISTTAMIKGSADDTTYVIGISL
jgi:hypothetical protein